MKPTAIIKDIQTDSSKPGYTRKYLCDNGVYYSKSQLAKTLGVKENTLFLRIKTHGCFSPKVFAPGDHRKNAEYKVLKDTARDEKLDRITLGTWEQEQMKNWVLQSKQKGKNNSFYTCKCKKCGETRVMRSDKVKTARCSCEDGMDCYEVLAVLTAFNANPRKFIAARLGV